MGKQSVLLKIRETESNHLGYQTSNFRKSVRKKSDVFQPTCQNKHLCHIKIKSLLLFCNQAFTEKEKETL